MKFFVHHRARYALGKRIGLGWLERFSLLTLKAAESLAWHRHDQTEVIACLRGTLNYEFRDAPSITLPPGCFLVIPSGTEHRVMNGIDSPCQRLSIFLYAKTHAIGRSNTFTPAEFTRLNRLLLRSKFRPIPFPVHLGFSLSRIATLIEEPPSREGNLELRTLAAFVVHSLASRPPPTVWQPFKNPMMDSAVQWLQKHFAEKLTVGQLAAFMGYGRSRLNALFREHTGLSPMEWLIRYRIEQAKKFLRSGLSVQETAAQTGFKDTAFFSKTFKQLMGASPRMWRDTPGSNS